MAVKEETKNALNAAYRSDLAKVYGVYVLNLFDARGNQQKIKAAQRKFKKALKLSQQALADTRRIAGLTD